jgi:hypothetical protein
MKQILLPTGQDYDFDFANTQVLAKDNIQR